MTESILTDTDRRLLLVLVRERLEKVRKQNPKGQRGGIVHDLIIREYENILTKLAVEEEK